MRHCDTPPGLLEGRVSDAQSQALAELVQRDFEEILRANWAKYWRRVQVRGVSWDRFSLDQLCMIVRGCGTRGMKLLVETLATDYGAWTGGFPDLLFWRREAPFAVRACEVKGPGDALSDTQRAWNDLLLRMGVAVEVVRVVDSKAKSVVLLD